MKLGRLRMKPHPFHLATALLMTWAGSIVAAPLANALPPELQTS